MTAISLYNIESALEQLDESRRAAEAEGDTEALSVIDAEIAAYLTREVAKIDSYAGLIRRRGDEAETCEREAKRLADRAKALRADEQRLKDNALAVMQRFGVRELKSPTNTLRVQGNGGIEPLDIPDWPKDSSGRFKPLAAEDLPISLVRTLTLYLPDTDDIRERLKRGEPLRGVRLLPRGEHLRIS